MRLTLSILLAAVLGAAAATALSTTRPLDEHAVDLRLRQVLPEAADELAGQSRRLRAGFLEFAGDRQLVLNARLALLRHPELARAIIPLYADSDAFRLVLREHGPAVIPPVHYFLTHEPATLRMRAQLVAWLSRRDGEPGSRPDTLTPRQRGRYAIEYIRREGHDFLGQFVVSRSGEVFWIQSERFATEAKRFLTSGITGLEIKRRLGEETYASDYGWAAVDVLLPFAAFKAARVGKAAATARAGAVTSRSVRAGRMATAGARAARTARIARFGRTAATAGVVVGAGYVLLNPGVIGSLGAEVARWAGLPAWLGASALWFLVLAPALFLLAFAYRWTLRPVVRILAGGARLHRRHHANRPAP